MIDRITDEPLNTQHSPGRGDPAGATCEELIVKLRTEVEHKADEVCKGSDFIARLLALPELQSRALSDTAPNDVTPCMHHYWQRLTCDAASDIADAKHMNILNSSLDLSTAQEARIQFNIIHLERAEARALEILHRVPDCTCHINDSVDDITRSEIHNT